MPSGLDGRFSRNPTIPQRFLPEHRRGRSDRLARLLGRDPLSGQRLETAPLSDRSLITREEALAYHLGARPGKIQVVPTKPTVTQEHLSMAYTPGVAEPRRQTPPAARASTNATSRA